MSYKKLIEQLLEDDKTIKLNFVNNELKNIKDRINKIAESIEAGYNLYSDDIPSNLMMNMRKWYKELYKLVDKKV